MSARLRALLAAAAVLLAAHALRVLPGDAPDEPAHAEYAAALADRGALPLWDWPARPQSYEAFQPPLYYAGAAALLNAGRGLPLSTRFFLMRFWSAALTLGALALVAALARRLDSGDGFGALAAACAVPMIFFDGATVTNDAAANLAGAALLWVACRRGPRGDRDAWATGALAGLALLCKTTTIPVVAVAGLALVEPRRDRAAASARRLALAVGTALVLCGWFYARNWRLYGDPFGLSRIAAYDRDRFAWGEVGRWLALFFESFWGRFGAMTRPMPAWAYAVCGAALAASLAGWARTARSSWSRPGRPVLAAALGLTLAQNAWYGFFRSYQPQARYSFPALAAFAVLFADGLGVWTEVPPAAWAAAAALVQAAALSVIR